MVSRFHRHGKSGTKSNLPVSNPKTAQKEATMSERFKNSLVMMWLTVSAVSLFLPVVLPSAAFSSNPTENVIGTATATMFVLSFPSSVFGIPLLLFVDYALGVDPNSIQGMYVNLFLLFVLGSVQWFWVVPRVWRNDPAVQVLAIQAMPIEDLLTEGQANDQFDVLDGRERTPVERVISEDEV
jgi:hypothetical protein